jgi:hypothetical protein
MEYVSVIGIACFDNRIVFGILTKYLENPQILQTMLLTCLNSRLDTFHDRY